MNILVEISNRIKKRKHKRLDERMKPGKSLVDMSSFVAMLDKDNVLSVKDAHPFMIEQDDDEDDEEDSEDREERKEQDKVERMKKRLGGRQEENVVSVQSLANKPVGVAKPKKKKVNENPNDPESYTSDDLPALMKILNPNDDETVNAALKAFVRIVLNQVSDKADGDDDENDDDGVDEGYMENVNHPFAKLLNENTERVIRNGKIVERIIR